MQKTPGNLACARQQERVCARNTLPHDAELPIGKPREAARIRQVAAYQRQVMRVVYPTDLADALGRLQIPQMAP
jgi:hypothetical protein